MGISLLGKNIKEYRNKKGLSLKKLTEIAEVGYATIYDLENGKKQNINSTTLEKVATALETSTNELLGIDVIEHTVDDIPDRRNNRQRRRSLRAVILPHHRRIHNGIHRGEVWRIVGHKGLRVEWNAPHPNWELYQVICGEVRLTTPDETVTAKPGELLRIPPYCTHSLEVLTDECELADMGCPIRLLNLLEDLRSMENAGEALPDAPAQRSCLLRRYGCFVTQWQYQNQTIELYPGRMESAEKEPSLPKR